MSAKTQTEPRWPAFIALLADGCLCLALPPSLSVGPRWLLLAIVFTLLVPIAFSHRQGKLTLARILMLLACGIITIALISSLIFLIEGLPKHREAPEALLRSATALWITNFLVFALWYWELDAGGPHGREATKGPVNSAFLFPQMLQPEKLGPAIRKEHASWSPQFMDYLFLAFNTSTAFSPTDTAVLGRFAKAGMMVQSLISLLIVAILGARAVGVL